MAHFVKLQRDSVGPGIHYVVVNLDTIAWLEEGSRFNVTALVMRDYTSAPASSNRDKIMVRGTLDELLITLNAAK